MTTIQSIELFTAVNLCIIGLSHLLQAKAWVDFFVFLQSKKNAGNIFNAMLSLGMGSLILAFHFIWYWPQLLITVYGALQVIKGLIYLLKPSIGIRNIGTVTMEKADRFRWAGSVMFILSLLIIYGLIKEQAF
jgi:hypothetical protein